MKTVLFIIVLLICAWPAGAFAAGPSVPGDRSGETSAASHPVETAGAKVKAFIHPETGEILTRERWRQLGAKNNEADSGSLSSSNALRQESAPAVLQGRQIDLGNGNSVIIVDTPDSDLVETKAWFDEEGKVHFKCNH